VPVLAAEEAGVLEESAGGPSGRRGRREARGTLGRQDARRGPTTTPPLTTALKLDTGVAQRGRPGAGGDDLGDPPRELRRQPLSLPVPARWPQYDFKHTSSSSGSSQRSLLRAAGTNVPSVTDEEAASAREALLAALRWPWRSMTCFSCVRGSGALDEAWHPVASSALAEMPNRHQTYPKQGGLARRRGGIPRRRSAVEDLGFTALSVPEL
jgi:hypothetical protein